MNELSVINRNASAQSGQPVPEPVVLRPAQPRQPERDQAGKAVPESGNSKPPEPPPIETKAAIEQLNQYLQDSHRSLVFEMNEDLGRTVIRVVNPVTKEVIREIPPDAARIMAAALRRGGFNLIDTLV